MMTAAVFQKKFKWGLKSVYKDHDSQEWDKRNKSYYRLLVVSPIHLIVKRMSVNKKLIWKDAWTFGAERYLVEENEKLERGAGSVDSWERWDRSALNRLQLVYDKGD